MARVSKRLRYEILRRDGFKCRYCGTVAADTELRVDHVVPEALGGKSDPSNLATACDPCNSGKSSVPPDAPVVDQVAEDALRWSSAMARAAADMEAKLKTRDEQNLVFLNEWNDYRFGREDSYFPLDPTWSASVDRLRSAGLTDVLIIEAVNATMGANKVLPENRFRYFCGVAWNMITQLQETAEKIATGEKGGSLFAELSRDDIECHLGTFQLCSEGFLKELPEWLSKGAEHDAAEDFRKAEWADPSRLDLLPHVVRHVGQLLAGSRIESQGDDA